MFRLFHIHGEWPTFIYFSFVYYGLLLCVGLNCVKVCVCVLCVCATCLWKKHNGKKGKPHKYNQMVLCTNTLKQCAVEVVLDLISAFIMVLIYRCKNVWRVGQRTEDKNKRVCLCVNSLYAILRFSFSPSFTGSSIHP